MLEQVFTRVREESDTAGKTGRFAVLKAFLATGPDAAPYAEVAIQPGTSEQGVKSAVHRMRKRFGELMREELRQTLTDPNEIESEMRHLLAALRD